MSRPAAEIPPDQPQFSRPVRVLKSLIKCGAIGFVLLLVMLYFLQRHLIYHPKRGTVLVEEFSSHVGPVYDVSITATDGVTLHGWLSLAKASPLPTDQVTPPTAEFFVERPQPFVLYFQGNAGNRSRRGMQVAMLNDLGCDVLIVDYRGYGDNDGAPSEKGLAADAKSICLAVQERYQVPVSRMVLFGESLGGGVATGLCHDLCAAGTPPAGLIIRASFSSLGDVASYHYPWLPVRWLLTDRYPSVERLPQITSAVLVLHGDADEVIPFSQGEQLFAAAPAQSASGIAKQFIRLKGTGHNDIMYVAGDQVRAGLSPFFEKVSNTLTAREKTAVSQNN
ncbi:MAG: alpha/beta hydrolase [Planctomycetaceae bacterium]